MESFVMQFSSFDFFAVFAVVSVTVPIVVTAITALSESLSSRSSAKGLIMPAYAPRVTVIRNKAANKATPVTRLAA
jgi:hypothetical protein